MGVWVCVWRFVEYPIFYPVVYIGASTYETAYIGRSRSN
jgi:hypothetical protein